ncbi:KEOPS complex kinase/ATPase Bud32, partial [Halorubrum sp. Hd13]|uniref:KEOPS complex kinase/ATPase Bud32 n=1 Tax=Halorubrum sp. Hd13 TaxID=1480728 RepID=UPI000B9975B5
ASVARGRGEGGREGGGWESDGGAGRRGAEATVEIAAAGAGEDAATGETRRVIKRRVPKRYRHPQLDRAIRRERTVAEARLTSEARRAGVPTPLVYDVDVPAATLTLQHVGDRDLAADLDERWTTAVGRHLARLHGAGIVHGDPTTRNVRIERRGERDARATLIDFGLAYHTSHVEDHAMDLHVFEGSVRATATEPNPLIEAFEAGYAEAGDGDVLDRLRTVEGRGRYR